VARHIASLAVIAALGLAPSAARADVTDELFQASILFEQAYLGNVRLGDHDLLQPQAPPTLGAALRVELLITKWIGLGVEGSAAYFGVRDAAVVPGARVLTPITFERHSLIAGTNGFLRLRFGLNNGWGEYYFIGGGGPAFMDHDTNDPSQYGPMVSGGSDMGWTAYGRFGMRGELVPGFGALVEIGYIHREHLDAFEFRYTESGSEMVTNLDYISNQLSITIGWYVSR